MKEKHKARNVGNKNVYNRRITKEYIQYQIKTVDQKNPNENK